MADDPLLARCTSQRVPIMNYFVPGLPRQQGDLQVGRHGKLFHKAKGLEQWRHNIAWRARKLMRVNGFGNVLFDGPVSVSLIFVLARPKAMPKSKPTPPAIKRPDIDKLTRAVFDALTGVVYVDDSQIIHDECLKRTAEFNEETGVIVEINSIVQLGDWVDEHDQ
jgi:crossover junction endodeoxyribonuclease RusA